MQQRQLRLGDILDDYCPRERRLTNHAVVAMIGEDVKQTRCTTCDADHEYKHARVPRLRRKSEPAALFAAVAATAPAPKKVAQEAPVATELHQVEEPSQSEAAELLVESQSENWNHAQGNEADEINAAVQNRAASMNDRDLDEVGTDDADDEVASNEPIEEGPVHRPLIRAQLPRVEGQAPPARQAPDFTIRQPAGRPGRFRPRQQRGAGQPFQGNRSNGNSGNGGNTGNSRGAAPRQHGGRPPLMSHLAKRHGPGGRKRSK